MEDMEDVEGHEIWKDMTRKWKDMKEKSNTTEF